MKRAWAISCGNGPSEKGKGALPFNRLDIDVFPKAPAIVSGSLDGRNARVVFATGDTMSVSACPYRLDLTKDSEGQYTGQWNAGPSSGGKIELTPIPV